MAFEVDRKTGKQNCDKRVTKSFGAGSLKRQRNFPVEKLLCLFKDYEEEHTEGRRLDVMMVKR